MKISSFLALAILSQIAPAFAAPPAPLPSQAVSIADLDLSARSDRTRLGHRIRHAVNAVCGEASTIDIAGQKDVRHCRDETRLSVQTQVNTAIAAAERGTVVASAD